MYGTEAVSALPLAQCPCPRRAAAAAAATGRGTSRPCRRWRRAPTCIAACQG